MKTPIVLLAAALVCGVLSARAEDATSGTVRLGPVQDIGTLPPPADTAPSLFPAAPPESAPTPSADSMPVPPAAEPTPLPAPTPTASPSDKKGSIEQLRQAIRIRELKTVALEDTQVQAELAKANCAKTPEGKRVLMRNYYTLLYTKMEKMDPSLVEPLERELYYRLRQFEQHTIRPSELIENVTPLPGSCSADHVPPGVNPDATPRQDKKKAKKF